MDLDIDFITGSSITDILSDTIQGAISGALIGGATAALTGGEFKDGAKIGAVVGGGKSIYDSWDETTTVNDTGINTDQFDGIANAPSVFNADNDTSLAKNDPYTLDLPENTGGLLSQPIDTSLNMPQGSDTSFVQSLKNGVKDMTPAQGKFYGELLKGLGTGVLSMEQAKDAKEAADLRYEQEKLKIQPGVMNSGLMAPKISIAGRSSYAK